VNSVLLSPLPYQDPNRLICLFEQIPSSKRSSISYPNLVDWRDMNRAFSAIAGYRGTDVNISWNGEAEHLPGEMISVVGTAPRRVVTFADELSTKAVVIDEAMAEKYFPG
jgi:hypothetical protein